MLGVHARLFYGFLLWALPCLWAAPVARAQEAPAYESGVVVVQFEPGAAIKEGAAKTGLEAFDRTAAGYGVNTIERVFPFLDYVQPTPRTERNLTALSRTYYVRYGAGGESVLVAKALASASGVVYAEPVIINHLLESDVRTEPNDSLFSDQTYLRHLHLPEAWDIVKGEDMSPPVVIAIADGGGDWRHEDLLANVWTNRNEIPDNGIDDDNNGFIDDVHGVNLCNGDDSNNDPFEPQRSWHGTTVAGAAGAVTDNGEGVAGAAWNAQLMHICGFSYEGILYAAANGADIVNASWGGRGDLQASTFIAQTLDLATDMGTLVVAGAGNDGSNNDRYPFYPSSYPRVLSVGATDRDSRRKAGFSNYGKMVVNVFAPGVDITTTVPNGGYITWANGTSYSAPLVSGIAALVKTRFPGISPDALREQIRLASANMDVENPDYAGMLGRGYVDAWAALQVPVFPAVRLRRWSWDDTDGDRMIASGEEVTIKATVVNHLADARQLTIGLQPAESYPFLDMTKAEHIVGSLAGGDSTEVTLRFTVASDAPPNRVVRFYIRTREGMFVDHADRLFLGINARIEEVHSALSALFVSTGGGGWRRKSGWDITMVPTPSQLAQWYGVTAIHGALVDLTLGGNNLRGTLPAELRDLSGLQGLNLCCNNISGEIPSELGSLSGLQRLQLGQNSLTGTIPSELGNLLELQQLWLYSNSLTGEIPIELGDLLELRALILHRNSLTGEIPIELGNLPELQQLWLFNNSLTGEIPIELGNLSQLQRLWLDTNSLTGEIPIELGNLSQLQRLDLDTNSLTGEIPSELGNLSQLTGLYLHLNSLTGEIPSELGSLSQLRYLSLSSNSLSGEIPSELGSLSQLRTLSLSRNFLSGAIPSELGKLSQLYELYMSSNSLSGKIPSELGSLSQLQRLSLSFNSLAGNIPHELSGLSQLRSLSLLSNSLTGEIPIELGNLSRLQGLYLQDNSLTGEIPIELGKLSQLWTLYLSSNALSGEIPDELGGLSYLRRLYLQDNIFTGRLPRSLMQLTRLQELHFGGQDLCAPEDDAFQAWLRSVPNTSGPTCMGIQFADDVADQAFTLGAAIAALVLPEAAGGTAPYSYMLRPALPAGLTFDMATRTIRGTPTRVTLATPYTYKAADANGFSDSLTFSIEVIAPTSAEHESLPEAFTLHGNYPNPFRHSTRLMMDLPWPARVTVEVMDVMGRRVLAVPSVDLAAGWLRSIDLSAAAMPSGLYLYRVNASSPEGRAVHAGRFVHVR